MKATIYFSDASIATVTGVDSINHAESVANILACRKSAKWKTPIYPTNVQVDSNNFSSMMGPNIIMEGVTVEN